MPCWQPRQLNFVVLKCHVRFMSIFMDGVRRMVNIETKNGIFYFSKKLMKEKDSIKN